MALGKPSMNEEWLTFADDGYHGLFETIKTPMHDDAGNVIGVLGIARDITLHKKTETDLETSKIFLETLLNAIPIPIFYKDTEGRYIGFNKAFEDLFDTPKETLIGKSVFDIAPKELAEIYHAKDLEVFQKPALRYTNQKRKPQAERNVASFSTKHRSRIRRQYCWPDWGNHGYYRAEACRRAAQEDTSCASSKPGQKLSFRMKQRHSTNHNVSFQGTSNTPARDFRR